MLDTTNLNLKTTFKGGIVEVKDGEIIITNILSLIRFLGKNLYFRTRDTQAKRQTKRYKKGGGTRGTKNGPL